jgi:hypothetical protein
MKFAASAEKDCDAFDIFDQAETPERNASRQAIAGFEKVHRSCLMAFINVDPSSTACVQTRASPI